MDSDQIVYGLDLSLDCFTGEAAGHLYLVQCEHCKQRVGSGGAAFPLVKASDFPEYTLRLNPNKPGPFLTLSEFRSKIIERARIIYANSQLELIPGSALGPIKIEPIGLWPKELKDIEFASPGGLLFSRALIDSLCSRGVHLPYQEAVLRNRKGFPNPYGIMQPSACRRLVHPETYTRNPQYRCCEYCEEVTVLDPWLQPLSQIILSSELRPKVGHLFRPTGAYNGTIFVSAALKSALDVIRPTGLSYVPFGIWHNSSEATIQGDK